MFYNQHVNIIISQRCLEEAVKVCGSQARLARNIGSSEAAIVRIKQKRGAFSSRHLICIISLISIDKFKEIFEQITSANPSSIEDFMDHKKKFNKNS